MVSLPGHRAQARDQADAHLDHAWSAMQGGDYEEAARWLSLAYEIRKETSILCNLGTAHDLAGHRAEACEAYRACMSQSEQGPPAPEDVSVAKVARRYQELCAPEVVAPKKDPPPPSPPVAPIAGIIASHPAKPQPAPTRASMPIYQKWWFWTTLSIAAAGAATGIALAAAPRDPLAGIPASNRVAASYP